MTGAAHDDHPVGPQQEQVLQDALKAGIIRSVEEFLDSAIAHLPCIPPDTPQEPGAVVKLVRKGKFLVLSTLLPPGWDPVRAIHDMRASRDRELLGL